MIRITHPILGRVRSDLYKFLSMKLAILYRMRGTNLAFIPLLGGIMLVSAACTPASQTPAIASAQAAGNAASSTPTQATQSWPRASRLARDLADAETAYDSRQNARLGQLVSALYASGLGPKGEDQSDMLEMWARASGGEAEPYRGRLLGPAYVRGELAPGERWKSAQTFKSGEPSTLAVSHKGAGPVSISVSDARERSVCKKGGKGVPACRFTPLYTQRYSIELVNEGQNRAVYFLVFD